MASNKIQTGLRLDETTHKKIVYIAEAENRTLNNLVEYLVKRYIVEYENIHGEIQISRDQ